MSNKIIEIHVVLGKVWNIMSKTLTPYRIANLS